MIYSHISKNITLDKFFQDAHIAHWKAHSENSWSLNLPKLHILHQRHCIDHFAFPQLSHLGWSLIRKHN